MKELAIFNMIPEYTRSGCSILGSWGKATLNGNLLHLRALDWDINSPAKKYPMITIYESNEPGSNVVANIGYAGLIGILTGMSKNGLTVGEKYLFIKDPSPYDIPPLTTYFGQPWMSVLRDTIQFSKNKDDIYHHLSTAKRTCSIHLGFASVPDRSFRGYDYAANWLYSYDDKNYTFYSESHPQLDGVFYLN